MTYVNSFMTYVNSFMTQVHSYYDAKLDDIGISYIITSHNGNFDIIDSKIFTNKL